MSLDSHFSSLLWRKGCEKCRKGQSLESETSCSGRRVQGQCVSLEWPHDGRKGRGQRGAGARPSGRPPGRVEAKPGSRCPARALEGVPCGGSTVSAPPAPPHPPWQEVTGLSGSHEKQDKGLWSWRGGHTRGLRPRVSGLWAWSSGLCCGQNNIKDVFF